MHHFRNNLLYVYYLPQEIRLIGIHDNPENCVDMLIAYTIYCFIAFQLELIWLMIFKAFQRCNICVKVNLHYTPWSKLFGYWGYWIEDHLLRDANSLYCPAFAQIFLMWFYPCITLLCLTFVLKILGVNWGPWLSSLFYRKPQKSC